MNRIFRYVIPFFSLLVLACASGKYAPRYFSREQLSFEDFPRLYQNVPFFQDSTIYLFIIELQPPEIPADLAKKGIVGQVVCHPLIDENGELEAVYIREPLHPAADNAAIRAVRNSSFRKLEEVLGQSGKYSLIISFPFYHLYEKELEYLFRKKDTDIQEP